MSDLLLQDTSLQGRHSLGQAFLSLDAYLKAYFYLLKHMLQHDVIIHWFIVLLVCVNYLRLLYSIFYIIVSSQPPLFILFLLQCIMPVESRDDFHQMFYILLMRNDRDSARISHVLVVSEQPGRVRRRVTVRVLQAMTARAAWAARAGRARARASARTR